ncbi:unnamed protein product [Rotaria socialis]|uniref:Uncharacterized protein n=1 Tax=Rotaria socialis TaxID=392032 RepID=A0A818QEC8_9BILA|nr:unnamed protein product [Rotaria socialis]
MKQNGLIENLVSLHQREHPTKQILNEEELQHVFTYGSWSNGKVNPNEEMICNACGIFYLMRLKTAIDRMNLSNSELAKSLFALKSKHLAGIRSDIKKNPIAEFQREKNDQMNGKKQHLNIPGYFPITPTILQVRQPEQTTYLDYGL